MIEHIQTPGELAEFIKVKCKENHFSIRPGYNCVLIEDLDCLMKTAAIQEGEYGN